jgi:hypothetical protein
MLYVKRFLYFFYAQYYQKPKSSTVKYAFPLIFTTLTLIGAALILPTDSSYVRLESSVKSVSEGEEFFINVYVGAHVPVNAIDISLTYPKEQIDIKAIDVGQSVITLWTQDPYVEGNKVIMRGGTFRKGFLGEHLVAKVEAMALKSGTAEFKAGSIDLLAGDGTGSEVSVAPNESQSLVIEVGNESGEIVANATVFISTDIDGDGKVGMNDILAFMSAWSSQAVVYDFNRDNRMNFRDFGIILSDSFYK